MRTKIDDAARADIIARLARDVHSVCPDAVVAYPCATLGYPRDVEILLDVFNVPENQMTAVDEATSATCMDALRRFTRYAVVITHPTPPPEGGAGGDAGSDSRGEELAEPVKEASDVRKFVTRVWRPVVAILAGIMSTWLIEYFIAKAWEYIYISGNVRNVSIAISPPSTTRWFTIASALGPVQPFVEWCIAAFYGGFLAGLVMGKHGWLYNAVCGFTLVLFILVMCGWIADSQLAASILVAATAGGTIAHWINYVRQQLKEKGLSHV